MFYPNKTEEADVRTHCCGKIRTSSKGLWSSQTQTAVIRRCSQAKSMLMQSSSPDRVIMKSRTLPFSITCVSYRKTNASVSTLILIHLVSAVFLLNLTFLINDVVASLKNPVACTILAALMHYFMLATFTWFAAQAFHLCMLLYVRSTIGNRHYLLKVSIVSWGEDASLFPVVRSERRTRRLGVSCFFCPFPVQPSVITIIMLSLGKYGKQVISTSDPKDDVAM